MQNLPIVENICIVKCQRISRRLIRCFAVAQDVILVAVRHGYAGQFHRISLATLCGDGRQMQAEAVVAVGIEDTFVLHITAVGQYHRGAVQRQASCVEHTYRAYVFVADKAHLACCVYVAVCTGRYAYCGVCHNVGDIGGRLTCGVDVQRHLRAVAQSDAAFIAVGVNAQVQSFCRLVAVVGRVDVQREVVVHLDGRRSSALDYCIFLTADEERVQQAFSTQFDGRHSASYNICTLA